MRHSFSNVSLWLGKDASDSKLKKKKKKLTHTRQVVIVGEATPLLPLFRVKDRQIRLQPLQHTTNKCYCVLHQQTAAHQGYPLQELPRDPNCILSLSYKQACLSSADLVIQQTSSTIFPQREQK